MFFKKSLQLLEKMGQKMMANLLLLQGSIIMLSVILAAMVFFPLGTITSNMGGECLLFSKIYISVPGNQLGNSSKLDLENTDYGSPTECHYTTFLSVTVAIAGIIFLWFLLHIGKVSEFEGSEAAFLLSVFLFYLVLFVCVLISSIKISSGFDFWCDNLKVCYNTADPSQCRELDCNAFSNIILDGVDNTSKFYVYFELAEISSWLLTLTLLIECAVTSQRIFQNVKATLVFEEQTAKKLDDTPASSINGIINQGSDEVADNVLVGHGDEGHEPEKQTLAEVTIHQENVIVSSDGGYEMSAFGEESAVKNESEKGVKQRRKNRKGTASTEGETENDKPREFDGQ